MISIGKKNLKNFSHKIKWIKENAENINFKKNFFDLIIFGSSFNVIKSNKIFNKLKNLAKVRFLSFGIIEVLKTNINLISKIIKMNIPKFNYGLRRSDPKKTN